MHYAMGMSEVEVIGKMLLKAGASRTVKDLVSMTQHLHIPDSGEQMNYCPTELRVTSSKTLELSKVNMFSCFMGISCSHEFILTDINVVFVSSLSNKVVKDYFVCSHCQTYD